MTDPTLQATGTLWSLLRLDWNATKIRNGRLLGMHAALDGIDATPPAPDQPWKQGKEYNALTGDSQVYGFGALISQGGGDPEQAGYAATVQIVDMSPATIIPGTTYAVTFGLMANFIQLYFKLTGSTAGTTVLPGFGVWNLPVQPGAWTYLTPTEFTDAWQIEILSENSVAPVLLSVVYAPPTHYRDAIETSKLVFTVSGGWLTQGWGKFPHLQSGRADLSPQRPDSGGRGGTQHLRRSSAPYVMRTKDGEALPAGG